MSKGLLKLRGTPLNQNNAAYHYRRLFCNKLNDNATLYYNEKTKREMMDRFNKTFGPGCGVDGIDLSLIQKEVDNMVNGFE